MRVRVGVMEGNMHPTPVPTIYNIIIKEMPGVPKGWEVRFLWENAILVSMHDTSLATVGM